MLLTLLTLVLATANYAQAHGEHEHHEQQPIDPNADWQTRHMAEEHLINSFDAASFFTLHDYDSSGEWTPEDILKTYGLKDESTKDVPQRDRDRAVQAIIDLYDRDGSATVSLAEFVDGQTHGFKLPDFGFGPGHHGDDEYEYEIHHFEKFHGPDATLEDMVHPEDIEHFRKHEMWEDQQARQEEMDRMSIVEANIPTKFRRYG